MVINSVSVFKASLSRLAFGALGLVVAGWLLGLNGVDVPSLVLTTGAVAGLLALGLSLALSESYRLDPENRQLLFSRRLLGRQSESLSCGYDGIHGVALDALKVERERGGPLFYYGLRLILSNGRKLELEPLADLSFEKTVQRGQELAGRLGLNWLEAEPRRPLKVRRVGAQIETYYGRSRRRAG